MKKVYEQPWVNMIDVECEQILTGSPDGNIGIDNKSPGGNEQLSDRWRKDWGTIW